MAEMKTKKTGASVGAFIDAVPNERRREDARKVVAMMKRVTKLEPEMWGPTIIGFGEYRYKYDSGREGRLCMIGFSPRAQALTFYLHKTESRSAQLKKLGKHKLSKACIYINKLADVDESVLESMIRDSYAYMKKTYGK